MRAKYILILGLVGLWGLLSVVWTMLGNAQAEEPAGHSEQHAAREETGSLVDPYRQPAPHHQRPAILSPEEEKAYSEFTHRVAGVFVFLAGGLALLATVGGPRYAWARHGWPGVFVLLGIFLFVRHDPESWPWGPLTFWESVTDVQVLQHLLFTLIVLAIGVIEWLRARGTLTHSAWEWLFPSLAISAAIMLLMGNHGEGSAADKMDHYHALMAVSGILAMIAKVFDDARLFDSRASAYIWTVLIMFVGCLLVIYTE